MSLGSFDFEAIIETFKGNAPLIKFTVTNEDNSATNLTGVTSPVLCFRKPNSSTVITKTVTITNPTGGLAEVRLSTTDTNTVGVMPAELRMTFSGNPITLIIFSITVNDVVCP